MSRGIMEEHDVGFVRYKIERPDRPSLVGIVGVLDIEGSTLYSHEGVMPSAVAARRADIERAGAHLEPIILASAKPIVLDRDLGAVLRSVNYGDEAHEIVAIGPTAAPVETAEYVILDGHHRIAATRHHSELTGEQPWILAMVVDATTPGLFVEPQHRVLGGPPLDLAALRAVADTKPYDRGQPVPAGAVAIVSRDSSVLVTPKRSPRSGALARISSLTLQEDLLPTLGQWVEGYATREVDAYSELDAGAQAVAIMADLEIDDVIDTASSGIVLPEKTTCFNPKVAVGLVGATLPVADSR